MTELQPRILPELKVGRYYKAEVLAPDGRVVLVETPELAELVMDAKLWWEEKKKHLFWCDQCWYFASNAIAVQEHSVEEHDCRFEVYYDVDQEGAQRVRVETVKCHPRITVKRTRDKPLGWGRRGP